MLGGRPWPKRPNNRPKPNPNNDPSRAAQQNQTSSQDRTTPGQQQNRQQNRAGGRGGQNTPSGNAWAGDGAKRDGPAAKMPQDEHIPVSDFNAQEVRDVLKQSTYSTRSVR